MQMIKVEIVKEEEEIYFKIEVSGDKYLFEKTEDLLRFAEQNKLQYLQIIDHPKALIPW